MSAGSVRGLASGDGGDGLVGALRGGAATAFEPAVAAALLLEVIDGLTLAQSGGFFDWRGEVVPW